MVARQNGQSKRALLTELCQLSKNAPLQQLKPIKRLNQRLSVLLLSQEPSPVVRFCVKYFGDCADYKRLDRQTQHVRRLILEGTFDEPIAPGSAKLFRDMPLSRMGTDAIEVLRDRKIDLPGAANNRVKAIRQVFKFGMRRKHPDGKPYVLNNPARDVEKFKYGSTGFHSWTPEEVRQFEQRHAVGTKARLALALLLFTGQRRADVIRFGKQHVRNGKLMFTQRKGRHRKPKQLALPILGAIEVKLATS